MALITPDELRVHFPQLKGTGEDLRLADVIASADALMALFCGWPPTVEGFHTLELAEYELFLAPRHGNYSVIDIPHGAPQLVDAAYIDPEWRDHISVQHPASTLVADSYLHLDRRSRELWIGSNATPYSQWSTVPRANKVDLQAGLSATPTPFDLVVLAATATRHLLDMPRFGSAAAVTQGGQSYTRTDFESLLPASVRNTLMPYVWWGSRVG